MADSPAKIQLPFHNAQAGAQAFPRRFRPARSVLTVVGLVCLLVVFISWPSSGSSGAPPSVIVKAKEDPPPAAMMPPAKKGQCEGMGCFAYSHTAGHVSYLCNALMMFESLHRLGSAADRVMLHNQEWKEGSNTFAGRMLAKAKNEYGVKLIPIKINAVEGQWTWQESFTKLYAFSLVQYKRVLALDSDSVLLQHMDDLFQNTPPGKLAATWSYWLSEMKLSSNLLLLEPSKVDFDRVLAAIAKRWPNQFDTEIVNQLFGKGAVVIPHRGNHLISGEFRSGGNHAAYVGEGNEWNATQVLEEARFVHFSDLMSPKPWTAENPEDVKNTVVPCWKHPDEEKEDCTSRDAWLWLYREHLKRRREICIAP